MALDFSLDPGSEIDGFRILDQIGEGGMATIHRVSKEGIKLPMVMKAPKLAFGSHPGFFVGFEVEQMVLAALSGPHVPWFIAKGKLETNPYIVMEHIEGPLLQDYVDQAVAIPEIARLVSALATAVHDLHRQNVIHLDIKPGNVLYRASGEAVLIDFGLARHSSLPDLLETAFDELAGSTAYLSPEQVRKVRSDPRSDIFAIGVILYQLSTGQLPFGAPTTSRGCRQRLYLDPIPPRCIKPDLPEWLQEITLHCLEARSADRYLTAAQVAYDLNNPQQVTITERGTRLKRAGFLTVARRWLAGFRQEPAACPPPAAHISGAPLILVALDTKNIDVALYQAVRDAVRRVVVGEAQSRITCATVLEFSMLAGGGSNHDMDTANNQYTQCLMELRRWASPLALSDERARFLVLDSTDPVDALVEYAKLNHVDHIIMGARGRSAMRWLLGNVAYKVATQAPCSVTVVRVPTE
ncbi:MAG: protein kinase [Burkholderiales bacterium]|nr:protein kinase [Burkholderiales bacterium]